MKHILSILTALIIFLTVSCGDDDPVKDDGGGNNNNGNNNPDTNTTKEYHHDFYPMRVGTEWEYKFVKLNRNSIIKVFSQDLIGKDTIFNLHSSQNYDLVDKYSKKPDGIYIQPSPLYPYHLFYKYPVTINEVYESTTFNVTVKNIDTLIKVPYGEFSCIQYLFESKIKDANYHKFDLFVNKDVGYIKRNYNDDVYGDVELIRYKY